MSHRWYGAVHVSRQEEACPVSRVRGTDIMCRTPTASYPSHLGNDCFDIRTRQLKQLFFLLCVCVCFVPYVAIQQASGPFFFVQCSSLALEVLHMQRQGVGAHALTAVPTALLSGQRKVAAVVYHWLVRRPWLNADWMAAKQGSFSADHGSSSCLRSDGSWRRK